MHMCTHTYTQVLDAPVVRVMLNGWEEQQRQCFVNEKDEIAVKKKVFLPLSVLVSASAYASMSVSECFQYMFHSHYLHSSQVLTKMARKLNGGKVKSGADSDDSEDGGALPPEFDHLYVREGLEELEQDHCEISLVGGKLV